MDIGRLGVEEGGEGLEFVYFLSRHLTLFSGYMPALAAFAKTEKTRYNQNPIRRSRALQEVNNATVATHVVRNPALDRL